MITIEKILLDLDADEKNILPALKKINSSFGLISEENARKAALYFNVPLSRIFETATFYDLLSTQEKALVEIKVCSGANCATKSANRLIEEIERYCHIQEGDEFNPKIKLEVISCLGQCGQGPVVIVNGTVFLGVNKSKIDDILKSYL